MFPNKIIVQKRNTLGKPQIKSSSLNGPFELNGRWKVGTLKKKVPKKSSFFLNGPPLYPPPPSLKGELFLRLPLGGVCSGCEVCMILIILIHFAVYASKKIYNVKRKKCYFSQNITTRPEKNTRNFFASTIPPPIFLFSPHISNAII